MSAAYELNFTVWQPKPGWRGRLAALRFAITGKCPAMEIPYKFKFDAASASYIKASAESQGAEIDSVLIEPAQE